VRATQAQRVYSARRFRSQQEIREKMVNLNLDFLFIDGDHSYDGVKHDFEMY